MILENVTPFADGDAILTLLHMMTDEIISAKQIVVVLN